MSEVFLNICGLIIRLKTKEQVNTGKPAQFEKFVIRETPSKIDMNLTLLRKRRYTVFSPKIFFEVKRERQKISRDDSNFTRRRKKRKKHNSYGRNPYIGSNTDWRIGKSGGRILLEGGSSTNYQVLLDRDLKSAECFIINDDKNMEIFDGVREFLKILFIYYMTKNRLGLMAHSAGIECGGDGYLFAGPHASGKSTLTRLWDRYAEIGIASDENIIIRPQGRAFYMHSTPWHGEFFDFKNSINKIKLKKVFFICHKKDNKAHRISQKRSFNLFFQSIFLPFWDKDCVDFASQVILGIVNTTPCYKMGFKKDDGSIVDYIRLFE